MATLNALDPNRCLRGKVGGLVYSLQPDGVTTVRTAGVRRVPFTAAEKRAQCRLRMGHAYIAEVMSEPDLRADYELQAKAQQMRLGDVIMADYLTDPVLAGVDTSAFRGWVGDPLLIIAGDDFKVTRVHVVVRDQNSHRLERGDAHPAQGCKDKVWTYRAQNKVAQPAALLLRQEPA